MPLEASSARTIMSFNAFNSYQLDTSDILDAPDIEPSNDYYQYTPFNTCQVPGMAQYGMDPAEDSQEVEESKSNARLKLGYKRASSACSKQPFLRPAWGVNIHASN